MSTKLYDVVAVNMATQKVRVIHKNDSIENAQAVVEMAVMRRGVETEFFAEAEAGLYQDGDTWAAK